MLSCVICVLLVGCNENSLTNNDKYSLALVSYGASTNEVYLGLRASTFPNGTSVEVSRDGDPMVSFASPCCVDTIIVDTSVSPNSTYSYDAIVEGPFGELAKSSIQVQTLTQSSNTFSWESFSFGGGDPSLLGDVFILDDNDIWAVGLIYLTDSSGQNDPNAYNAVHWDGSEWNLMRIPVLDFGGSIGIQQLRTVYAFSESSVWLSSAANLIEWNGQDFESRAFFGQSLPFDGQVTSMWGSEPSNIVCGAKSGNVYFYSGDEWHSLPPGTEDDITDVFGVTNPFGEEEVFCSVTSFFEPGDKKILRYTQSKSVLDSIEWGTGRNIESMWTLAGFPIYACGSGVFENSKGYWREVSFPVAVYSESITGNSFADMVVAGDLGFAAHFDGDEWQVLTNIPFADYYEVKIKNDTVVLVGEADGRGVVTVGRRF